MLSSRCYGQCMCVCLRTCAIKASECSPSEDLFFISTRERSRALQGAGERTQAYLCFYEPLRIRLAWSNLPQPRPLSPQMQETRREEGVIEKPPVQNVWSMAARTTPLPVCIASELSGQSPRNFTSGKTPWCSKTRSWLIYTSLQEKGTAIASAILFYTTERVLPGQHEQMCFLTCCGMCKSLRKDLWGKPQKWMWRGELCFLFSVFKLFWALAV